MDIFGDSKVFCNINRFMAEVYLGCALNLLLGTRSETNEKAKKYDYRGSGAANLTKWLILTPEFPGLNPHPQMLLSIYFCWLPRKAEMKRRPNTVYSFLWAGALV